MSAYRITLAGGTLSYIALAPSSCLALADALQRHGLQAISVRPVAAGGRA